MVLLFTWLVIIRHSTLHCSCIGDIATVSQIWGIPLRLLHHRREGPRPGEVRCLSFSPIEAWGADTVGALIGALLKDGVYIRVTIRGLHS